MGRDVGWLSVFIQSWGPMRPRRAKRAHGDRDLCVDVVVGSRLCSPEVLSRVSSGEAWTAADQTSLTGPSFSVCC